MKKTRCKCTPLLKEILLCILQEWRSKLFKLGWQTWRTLMTIQSWSWWWWWWWCCCCCCCCCWWWGGGRWCCWWCCWCRCTIHDTKRSHPHHTRHPTTCSCALITHALASHRIASHRPSSKKVKQDDLICLRFPNELFPLSFAFSCPFLGLSLLLGFTCMYIAGPDIPSSWSFLFRRSSLIRSRIFFFFFIPSPRLCCGTTINFEAMEKLLEWDSL